MRCIYCPGKPTDRWVPLGFYVQAIKMAKAHPDTEFKHGLGAWWPVTGRHIIREFRRGMHERINAGPRHLLGRRG